MSTTTDTELDLVTQIAPHVPGFTAVLLPPSSMGRALAVLRNTDGVTLYVRPMIGQKDRLVIGFEWPRAKNGTWDTPPSWLKSECGDPTTSITVTSSKTPDKIGRDITTRLLTTNALRLWTAMVERIKANDSYRDATKATVETLERMVPGARRSTQYSEGSDSATVYGVEGVHQINVHGESVTFEVRSVSPSTAMLIFDLLKAERKP